MQQLFILGSWALDVFSWVGWSFDWGWFDKNVNCPQPIPTDPWIKYEGASILMLSVICCQAKPATGWMRPKIKFVAWNKMCWQPNVGWKGWIVSANLVWKKWQTWGQVVKNCVYNRMKLLCANSHLFMGPAFKPTTAVSCCLTWKLLFTVTSKQRHKKFIITPYYRLSVYRTQMLMEVSQISPRYLSFTKQALSGHKSHSEQLSKQKSKEQQQQMTKRVPLSEPATTDRLLEMTDHW